MRFQDSLLQSKAELCKKWFSLECIYRMLSSVSVEGRGGCQKELIWNNIGLETATLYISDLALVAYTRIFLEASRLNYMSRAQYVMTENLFLSSCNTIYYFQNWSENLLKLASTPAKLQIAMLTR